MSDRPASALIKRARAFVSKYRLAVYAIILLPLLCLVIFRRDLTYITNLLTVIGLAFTAYLNVADRSLDQRSTEAVTRLNTLIELVKTDPVDAAKEWARWRSLNHHQVQLDTNPVVAERYSWFVKKLREKIPYLLYKAGRELHYWHEAKTEFDRGLRNKSNALTIIEICSDLLADRSLSELIPEQEEQNLSDWLKQVWNGFQKQEAWAGGRVVDAAFSLWKKYRPAANEIVVQILLQPEAERHQKQISQYFEENTYAPLLNDARLRSIVRANLQDRGEGTLSIHPWQPPLPDSRPEIQERMRHWLSLVKFQHPLVTIPFDRDILLHITPFPSTLLPNFQDPNPILYFSQVRDDLAIGARVVSHRAESGVDVFPILYPLTHAQLSAAIKAKNPRLPELINRIASVWADFLEQNPDFYFYLFSSQQEKLDLLFSRCHDPLSRLVARLESCPEDMHSVLLLNHLKQNVQHRTAVFEMSQDDIIDILYLHPNGYKTTRLIILFDSMEAAKDIRKYIDLVMSNLTSPDDPGIQIIFFSPCPAFNENVREYQLRWSRDDLRDALNKRIRFAQLTEESIFWGSDLSNGRGTGIEFDSLFNPYCFDGYRGGRTPANAVTADAKGSLAHMLHSIHRIIQNHLNQSVYPSDLLTEEDINLVCPLDVPDE